MSVTDDLLRSAERFASSFDGGGVPVAPARRRPNVVVDHTDCGMVGSPFIPHEDDVRGFASEVQKGTLREVE
jgi:hypothetical protein